MTTVRGTLEKAEYSPNEGLTRLFMRNTYNERQTGEYIFYGEIPKDFVGGRDTFFSSEIRRKFFFFYILEQEIQSRSSPSTVKMGDDGGSITYLFPQRNVKKIFLGKPKNLELLTVPD